MTAPIVTPVSRISSHRDARAYRLFRAGSLKLAAATMATLVATTQKRVLIANHAPRDWPPLDPSVNGLLCIDHGCLLLGCLPALTACSLKWCELTEHTIGLPLVVAPVLRHHAGLPPGPEVAPLTDLHASTMSIGQFLLAALDAESAANASKGEERLKPALGALIRRMRQKGESDSNRANTGLINLRKGGSSANQPKWESPKRGAIMLTISLLFLVQLSS